MIHRSLLIAVAAGVLFAGFLCLYLGYGRLHTVPPGASGFEFQPTNLGLSGIAVDSDGNVFISAGKLNRILEVSSTRQIRLVAGNGNLGFAGDGGPAPNGTLAQPMGIALDSERNLFVADMSNNRIRRIDAKTATIVTVAGNGILGGGIGDIATNSGLYAPISVAIDEYGNLYVGGTRSPGIRRVDAITGVVSGVLGAGMPGAPWAEEPAAGPFWVAPGKANELFIADLNRNTVSWLDVSTDSIGVLAGSATCGFTGDGEAAIGALLCFPEGMALGKDKRLFIADTGNNRIRAVDLAGGTITTVAGNGEPRNFGDGGRAINASLRTC